MNNSDAGPSPKKRHIKLWVTPEEKQRIAQKARDCGLSISSYGKHVCMGYLPRSILDNENVQKLMKVNGDLGRSGGLLKLLLGSLHKNEANIRRPEINDILGEIRKTQSMLQQTIADLTTNRIDDLIK